MYILYRKNFYISRLLLTCLVPLQAKNPKMSIKPPKAERGTEWPGIGTGRPFLSKRPMRGPMRTQPTKAHTAENDIIKHL